MVAMTTLRKAPNGDWFSRKEIPKDVRDSYQAAFGVSREERFRRPASMPVNAAKAEMRDWDATVSQRIETLRAVKLEASITLTPRQISALCGEWYAWFVAGREENPGSPDTWDSFHASLMSSYDGVAGLEYGEEDIDKLPLVKRRVHARVLEIGAVATFLAEKQMRLSEATMDAFLSAMKVDLIAALALLRRRAGGDYSPDERLTRFAGSTALTASHGKKLAGLDCWRAFEAWVKERNPAPATVNRWRGVFLEMNDYFQKRDVATITGDEAVTWKGTLVTEKRSGQVVNDVWLRAVKVVFNWLVDDKKLTENPFVGVRVAAAKKTVKRRERAFKAAEWQAILSASLLPPPPRMKAEKAATRRWVPWLCAYTGARPGEMTQLHGGNVYREDGHWIIEISPEDGTVKGASFRKVPIHEHLIAQGFLDFVKARGPGPLFYDPAGRRKENTDPTKPVRQPYEIARQKLADWVRSDVGVTDTDISPNHAWRHTFKRQAARSGMERRFRFAFCGHETGEIGDIYEMPTLEDMAEELKKFPRYDLSEVVVVEEEEEEEAPEADPEETP